MVSCELRWAFNATLWEPTRNELLKALSCISKEECLRIQQFRFKEDLKLSLVGRLMIRKALQKALGIRWNLIRLFRTEKGKPAIHYPEHSKDTFYFNVSHDGDFTVLSGSKKHEIGVDVMKFSRPQNTDIESFFKLMQRQLSNRGWLYVRSFQKEEDRLHAFYRLWCLRESYVKAVGTGIGTENAEVMSFVINEEISKEKICGSSALFLNNEKAKWTFEEHLLQGNHVVSIASENINSQTSIPFELFSFQQLIEDSVPLQDIQSKWWDDYLNKDDKKLLWKTS